MLNVYGIANFDYSRRDTSNGTWLDVYGSNLGLQTRELGVFWTRQGDWKLNANYGELWRVNPYTVNTGVSGSENAPQANYLTGGPVYVDGRMIGAVSYALGSFATEPIAGITPIGEMVEATARGAGAPGPPIAPIPMGAALSALTDAFAAALRPARSFVPLAWPDGAQGSPFAPVDLAELDVMEAMRDLQGYLDISPGDFQELYHASASHALARLARNPMARALMRAEGPALEPEQPLSVAVAQLAAAGVKSAAVVDPLQWLRGLRPRGPQGQLGRLANERGRATDSLEFVGDNIRGLLLPNGAVIQQVTVAGGHADVQADPARRVYPESVQRPFQFQPAAGDIGTVALR